MKHSLQTVNITDGYNTELKLMRSQLYIWFMCTEIYHRIAFAMFDT